MPVSYVTDVLHSIDVGDLDPDAAVSSFRRILRTLCWEFLSHTQRTRLEFCVDNVLAQLVNGEMDVARADDEINGLIDAAILRDTQKFETICERNHP